MGISPCRFDSYRSHLPSEEIDEPKEERQDEGKNDGCSDGEIEFPVFAAKFDIAWEAEKADVSGKHYENADCRNGDADENKNFAELLKSKICHNAILYIVQNLSQ